MSSRSVHWKGSQVKTACAFARGNRPALRASVLPGSRFPLGGGSSIVKLVFHLPGPGCAAGARALFPADAILRWMRCSDFAVSAASTTAEVSAGRNFRFRPQLIGRRSIESGSRMATTDYNLAADRGLPSNVEAERSLLGAILLDNALYTDAGAALKPDDFFLDSHRRIYSSHARDGRHQPAHRSRHPERRTEPPQGTGGGWRRRLSVVAHRRHAAPHQH